MTTADVHVPVMIVNYASGVDQGAALPVQRRAGLYEYGCITTEKFNKVDATAREAIAEALSQVDVSDREALLASFKAVCMTHKVRADMPGNPRVGEMGNLLENLLPPDQVRPEEEEELRNALASDQGLEGSKFIPVKKSDGDLIYVKVPGFDDRDIETIRVLNRTGETTAVIGLPASCEFKADSAGKKKHGQSDDHLSPGTRRALAFNLACVSGKSRAEIKKASYENKQTLLASHIIGEECFELSEENRHILALNTFTQQFSKAFVANEQLEMDALVHKTAFRILDFIVEKGIKRLMFSGAMENITDTFNAGITYGATLLVDTVYRGLMQKVMGTPSFSSDLKEVALWEKESDDSASADVA